MKVYQYTWHGWEESILTLQNLIDSNIKWWYDEVLMHNGKREKVIAY